MTVKVLTVMTALWRWPLSRGRRKTIRSSLATADSEGVMTAVWRQLLSGGRRKTTRPILATADSEGVNCYDSCLAVAAKWRKKEDHKVIRSDSRQ